jgi:trimeric autotransporter adhesin
MKNILKTFIINLLSISAIAQNSITTPTGTPLTIGNNGVRLANLTSASTPSASNNLALSVNGTGDIILVPAAASGGGDPSFRIVNSNNTMGGTGSGNATTALGVANTFFGFNAGYATGATATSSQNAYFGANAGVNSTAACCNTFAGASAGVFNTFGGSNTFLGQAAGGNNRTGNQNIMIGVGSGYDGIGTTPKNSNYNVLIGNYTGINNVGDFNVTMGYAAAQFNTTGGGNISIGGYANGHTASTTNNNCTFLGTQSGTWSGTNHAAPTAVANNLINATAIGYQAQVTISNALTLGGVGANAVKVGIGLNNPAYPLDIKGVVNMRVAYNEPSMKINDRDFMGVGEEGEFWVSNFKMRYQNENQWSDKVFEKNYKLLTINELEHFISKNNHLPNIPSASEVVKKGVDNAEMTAKLLEKIEEMSLYIIQLEKRLSQVENKR